MVRKGVGVKELKEGVLFKESHADRPGFESAVVPHRWSPLNPWEVEVQLVGLTLVGVTTTAAEFITATANGMRETRRPLLPFTAVEECVGRLERILSRVYEVVGRRVSGVPTVLLLLHRVDIRGGGGGGGGGGSGRCKAEGVDVSEDVAEYLAHM
ncbi:hypothetical protein Pcinc_020377 [Petrolisthes cinctipes]|uniref:Uncharacterized protein n=1 Tax=Petrolisthes cinctipes TaxID=88211 RepID=A0AAE1KGI1_PETCI|nr:hypothetical protein Pcinc_020377 [Petrolisthes cinctipes]